MRGLYGVVYGFFLGEIIKGDTRSLDYGSHILQSAPGSLKRRCTVSELARAWFQEPASSDCGAALTVCSPSRNQIYLPQSNERKDTPDLCLRFAALRLYNLVGFGRKSKPRTEDVSGHFSQNGGFLRRFPRTVERHAVRQPTIERGQRMCLVQKALSQNDALFRGWMCYSAEPHLLVLTGIKRIHAYYGSLLSFSALCYHEP